MTGDPGGDVVYVVAVLASTLPFGQSEVAALSLTDGSLRWRAPTTGSPTFVGATPDQVAVRSDGLESPAPGLPASSTLVLDAGTGELSWERAGFAAEVLSGDALLGSWPSDPPSEDPLAPGLPGCTAACRGRGALAERRADGDRPRIHRPDLSVLEGADDTAFVVDLSDGTDAAEIEGASCVDDGADAIVCGGTGPDGVAGLASVAAGEAEPTWSEHEGSIAFSLGYLGYLIGSARVLDRYGTVLAEDVPGVEPLTVEGDTLIVLEGTDPTALTATAHRIAGRSVAEV